MSEPTPNNETEASDAQLSAYLDGELSASERADLDALLASEPALQIDLEALRGVREFLMDHGRVPAPADFLESVLAAAEEEPVVQLAWYRRPFGIPASGLAVAAAAMLVIYVALPGGKQPELERAPGTKTGAGAAQIDSSWNQNRKQDEPETPEEPAVQDRYGYDNTVAAKDQEAVDPTLNKWEPPTEKDVDATVMMDAATKKAGVNDKLALPAMSGTDLGDEVVATTQAVEGTADAPGEDAQGTDFSRVPYSYTITTEDAEVLFRLATMAAKHRGLVTESNNRPLQIEELTGSDAATVLVKIPAHALQDFGRELDGLGIVRASADNTVFAGDPVEVRVTVRLAGGAPMPEPAGINAARRMKNEADNMANEVVESL